MHILRVILFYMIRAHEILAILIIFKKMEGKLPMAPQPPAPYYQPPAYQPLLTVTYSQQLPEPQAVTYSQPLPEPQAVTYSQPLPEPQAVMYRQPLPEPQAVTYSQPLPEPQAAYGDYAPEPQEAVVTILGSGATRLSPTNNCVICMSVFGCLCCCTSMGIVALVLALVARVFRTDPSNAVKAVTLNRYAFRLAIAAIIAGIVIFVLRFVLRFIVYFSIIIISSYNNYYPLKFRNVVSNAFENSLEQLVNNMF